MIYTTPKPHIFHGEKNMVSCRLSQQENSIHGGFPIGFSLINHPFLGIPIYGNSHIIPHIHGFLLLLICSHVFNCPRWDSSAPRPTPWQRRWFVASRG